jgi:phosphoserine phosphatase RsbU/P
MATSSGTALPPMSDVRTVYSGQVEHLLKVQKWAQKISSILDLDQLIDQIVNEMACAFGCLEANLYLHDEEHSELEIVAVHGCTVNGKGSRLKIGKEGMVGYVAATRKMRYAPDVRRDPYYIACEPETRSEVAIPLLTDGTLVGVFTASHHELDAFPDDQLRLLQAMCNHIAVAINNARRFQYERKERERMAHEAREARLIQEALLPKSSPYIPGFAISGLSVPAGDVGGDWFDFIPFEDGRWGLVLADVSGKGTAAALLMSATRAMLRSLAQANCSPAEVLGKLNTLLVNDIPSGRFVTLVYAVLNPATRTLTFANAGHLRPLLVNGHNARFLDSERGTPLGLVSGDFSECTVALPQGARVVMYSDGITEAAAPDETEYGPERLRDHALKPEISADSILADVRSFVNGAGLRDDATVIFLRA